MLDKCLIYNLRTFLNTDDITQMMYGFLVNLDIISEREILKDIASRFSNVHNIVKNHLNSLSYDNVSERTIINYFKNLKNENIDVFTSDFKNNFLYFYYPSLIKEDQDDLDKIINDKIKEKGKDFGPFATSFSIECKKPKDLLYYYNKKIEKKKKV